MLEKPGPLVLRDALPESPIVERLVGIEHFLAVAFVESFNKRILIRFDGLDIADPNAMLNAETDKSLCTDDFPDVDPLLCRDTLIKQ